jgi:ribosomal protein S18 acetylase RimI-like enzyme
MRLTTRHRPKEKHYYLTCLGVSPEFMGKKIGKKMLDTIHNIVDEDITSMGIGLDTENPDNIALMNISAIDLWLLRNWVT